MMNEFFECYSNIPIKAKWFIIQTYKPYKTCGLLLLSNNSQDAQFFSEFTGQ